MSPQRWLAAIAVLGVIAAAVGAGAGAAETADRSIEIDIRYSHFRPEVIRVPVGVPIRFVLVNADPIDHEWIVGDAAVHDRHRTGTEPSHGARPTEQSIAAGETIETVVTFETPGTLTYVCHLPGHEAYGMVGTIVVSASS
jgi:uncharacterized cupredoxin-like copper-binding protein